MEISLASSWKAPVVSMMTLGLLGPLPLAHSAQADSPNHRQALEIVSKPAGHSSERHGPAKPSPRQPMGKPDASGRFVGEILDNIRARSAELCARYGSPGDCLEEAEVCLTMRNPDDDEIRLCLNTSPGENDRDTARKTRFRR